jgi:hypothetical protein
VSVDYRLLHQFRISQRRQMASRGELPVRFNGPETGGDAAFDSDDAAFDSYEVLDLTEQPVAPEAQVSRLQVPRVQVLTHLLNEDR